MRARSNIPATIYQTAWSEYGLWCAMQATRRRDREDMVLAEVTLEGGAAMAGGAEHDRLRRVRRIGLASK
jgi:hypothetical protein